MKLPESFKTILTKITNTMLNVKQQGDQKFTALAQRLKPHWEVPQKRYPFMMAVMTSSSFLLMTNLAPLAIVGAGVAALAATYIAVEGMLFFQELKQTVVAAKSFMQNADKTVKEISDKAVQDLKISLNEISDKAVKDLNITLNQKADKAIKNVKKVIREASLETNNTLFVLGEDAIDATLPVLKETLKTLKQGKKTLKQGEATLVQGEATLAQGEVTLEQGQTTLIQTLEQGTKTLEQAESACRQVGDGAAPLGIPTRLTRSVLNMFSYSGNTEKESTNDSCGAPAYDPSKNQENEKDDGRSFTLDF